MKKLTISSLVIKNETVKTTILGNKNNTTMFQTTFLSENTETQYYKQITMKKLNNVYVLILRIPFMFFFKVEKFNMKQFCFALIFVLMIWVFYINRNMLIFFRNKFTLK